MSYVPSEPRPSGPAAALHLARQNDRRENPILGFCSIDQSSPSATTTINARNGYQNRGQAPCPVPEAFRSAGTMAGIPEGSSSAFDVQWSELMATVRDIQQQLREFHAEFQRSSSEWSQAPPAVPAALETLAVQLSTQQPNPLSSTVSIEEDQSQSKAPRQIMKSYTTALGDATQGAPDRRSSPSVALQQFERLRDPSNGLLTSVQLEKLADRYCHRELENITEALRFAIGDQLQDIGNDSSAKTNRRHSLGGSAVDAGPAAACFGFDANAFNILKSEGIVAKASFGIHRDLTTVQETLRKEEMNYLYQDDAGADDFDDKSFPSSAKKYSMVVLEFLESVPTLVVFLQAFTMGMSAELYPESIAWEIIEVLFTAVYLAECIFKVHIFGVGGYFCGPQASWHWLDFFCLCISLVDLIVTFTLKGQVNLSMLVLFRLLRLFKLTRLLKMLRLHVFKELNLMLMGLISGGRVLAWAVVILIIIIYIFALVMNKLAVSHKEFKTMTASMATLFRCFTEGCATYEGAPLTEKLRHTYGEPIYIFYSLAYIFVTVGVFNLIMALFIDNVVNTQHERKQQHLSDSAQAAEIDLKDIIMKLVIQSKASGVPLEVEDDINSLDNAFSNRVRRVRAQFQCLSDANIHILGQQFSVWLEDKHFLRILENAEIDVHNKASLFEVLDADLSGSVTVKELLNGLMKLRGPVTKSDIIAIRLKVRQLIDTLCKDA
eukprot:TRINITY_DN25191_c0_g1_i1.p1 TRINITY_DN25191_c0_g1~~TRINITY_DN25191_c0_g1_i1.p1  ORF type:complete len:730 (-),score=126.94 TRINITY_DN25191_c0_g1_i1:128-2287(-)